LKEARVIDLLKEHGASEHIVTVFGHGWLPQSSHYFIDMELYAGTLEEYIQDESSVPYTLFTNRNRDPFPKLIKREDGNIWDMMEQIANGLAFVHGGGYVHRDVKPRNSSSLVISYLTLL
jgi:serine/threonine protein kinase